MGKRAIIMGATSGIGYEVAVLLLQRGWSVGMCGRRTDRLLPLATQYKGCAYVLPIDITSEEAPGQLLGLIEEMGGMNLYLHSSGIGYQNKSLDIDKEMRTVETNALGFTRMMTAVFHYYEAHPEQHGHMACISSIAGTKGLGASPSYSATKRFCSTYMECLQQLTAIRGLNIGFTDIRPGFVATDLLERDYRYPMLMLPDNVARQIVHALECRKRVAIIDWRYQLLVYVWRMIPSWLWVKMKIQ